MNYAVAFDGSRSSQKALEFALKTSQNKAKITVLNVVQRHPHADIFLSEQEIEAIDVDQIHKAQKRVPQQVQQVLDRAPEPKPSELPEIKLETGADARTALLDLLAKEKYDMLFIGSRGLSGMSRYFGSVSKHIVEQAPIPVCVVRDNDEQQQQQ